MGDGPARAGVDGAGGGVQIMGNVEVLDADISGETTVVDRCTSGDGLVQPIFYGEGVAAPQTRNCVDRVGVCPDGHAGIADKRSSSRAEPQRGCALLSSR